MYDTELSAEYTESDERATSQVNGAYMKVRSGKEKIFHDIYFTAIRHWLHLAGKESSLPKQHIWGKAT